MAKKIVITDDQAIRIATKYANSSLSEREICYTLNITKHFFRKAIDKAIVLYLIDDETAKKVAKKADANYNKKLSKLGYEHSIKVKCFYDSLFEKREQYLKANENLNAFKSLSNDAKSNISKFETNLESALYRENSLDSYISSDDERYYNPGESSYIIEQKIAEENALLQGYLSKISQSEKVIMDFKNAF